MISQRCTSQEKFLARMSFHCIIAVMLLVEHLGDYLKTVTPQITAECEIHCVQAMSKLLPRRDIQHSFWCSLYNKTDNYRMGNVRLPPVGVFFFFFFMFPYFIFPWDALVCLIIQLINIYAFLWPIIIPECSFLAVVAFTAICADLSNIIWQLQLVRLRQ